MKKLFIILAIVVALAGFGIYKLFNTFGKAGELGDKAIAEFHVDFNAKRFDSIHAAASPAFRDSVPMPKFGPFAAMLHEKLGEWKSGERTGIQVKTNNGRETLEMTCSAKFANGEGTEEFIFDYDGDKPLLLGYNVKSPALLAQPDPEEPVPAPANP